MATALSELDAVDGKHLWPGADPVREADHWPEHIDPVGHQLSVEPTDALTRSCPPPGHAGHSTTCHQPRRLSRLAVAAARRD